MKKIIVSVLIIIILAVGLFISSGYGNCYDVAVTGYSVSESGDKITLDITRIGSMGFVRDIDVKIVGGEAYVSFYQPYGGLNSHIGARSTFEIPLEDSTYKINFEIGKDTYKTVLQKDFETDKWENVIMDNYYDKEIAKELLRYYNGFEPQAKGGLKILQTKPYGEKKLVLAQKYFGEGHSVADLFVTDSAGKIIAHENVTSPMSPCFSLAQVFYEGKTILFGEFDNGRWLPQPDIVVKVDIDEVYARLKSGASVQEKVNINNGFILVLDGTSGVEVFDLYNDQGELQAVITDNVVYKTEIQ